MLQFIKENTRFFIFLFYFLAKIYINIIINKLIIVLNIMMYS